MEAVELIAAVATAGVALGAVVVAVLWKKVKTYVANTEAVWDDDLAEAVEDAFEKVLARRGVDRSND